MRQLPLPFFMIIFFVCTGSAFSQVLGARLLTLVDLGTTAPFEQFGRQAVLFGDSFLGITKDYEMGYKREDGAVVIIDYQKYKINNYYKFGDSSRYGIVKSKKHGLYLCIEYHKYDYKIASDSVKCYFLDQQNSVSEYNFEDIKENFDKTDIWPDISRWPKEIPIPEPLDWKLRYDATDWTIFQEKAIILNEFDVGIHDGSMQTIGVYDMSGAFLFRFPYIIMPGGGEYGNPAKMNSVQMSKDKKWLMINGHAMLYDIYTELKGVKTNARHEFVWIYELLTDEEWNPKPREEATIIRLAPDLSEIEWTGAIASERFNIIPGTNCLYGTRGTLKYDRVNLRKEPSLKSSIIVTMDKVIHFADDPRIGFMIMERSEYKDTVNGEDDYWYRIFFRLHEYEEYEGWVFGSTITMHDPKIPYDSYSSN